MIRKRLNAMVERKKNRPSPPRGAAVQRSENRGERIENKLSKEKLQQEKNVKISTKLKVYMRRASKLELTLG